MLIAALCKALPLYPLYMNTLNNALASSAALGVSSPHEVRRWGRLGKIAYGHRPCFQSNLFLNLLQLLKEQFHVPLCIPSCMRGMAFAALKIPACNIVSKFIQYRQFVGRGEYSLISMLAKHKLTYMFWLCLGLYLLHGLLQENMVKPPFSQTAT